MLQTLLDNIANSPETVQFDEVIETIEQNYHYTPVTFINGTDADNPEDIVVNDAGTNEGSCKIFAFASLNGLSERQTLHCFGDYYRKDVLAHPDESSHANIRTFMKYGWAGISFDKPALEEK